MKAESVNSRWVVVIVVAAIAAAAIIFAFAYYSPSPPQSTPAQDSPDPSEFEDSTPQIDMVYSGESYTGHILGSNFEANRDVTELPEPIFDDISTVPAPAVAVAQESSVTFVIIGGPWITGEGDELTIEPDALTIDAHPVSGSAETLAIEQGQSETFTLDLPPGEYVLTATATWLAANPPEETGEAPINGYVVYGYRIMVE
jgi:hypothetical protein